MGLVWWRWHSGLVRGVPHIYLLKGPLLVGAFVLDSFTLALLSGSTSSSHSLASSYIEPAILLIHSFFKQLSLIFLYFSIMKWTTISSFGIAAISTFSSFASAAWNISAKNNVALYWGQNAFGSFNNDTTKQQKDLLWYCQQPEIDVGFEYVSCKRGLKIGDWLTMIAHTTWFPE